MTWAAAGVSFDDLGSGRRFIRWPGQRPAAGMAVLRSRSRCCTRTSTDGRINTAATRNAPHNANGPAPVHPDHRPQV